MKKTIIMAWALSAIYMNVQCMDGGERQETIQKYRREQEKQKEKPQSPPPYVAPPAFVQSSLASATAPLLINHDAERGVVINPEENNTYNGRLYPANSTTFGQFWRAQGIPVVERYRSGPQLDEYVSERNAQACCKCCGDVGCVLCTIGAAVGALTGLVYCCKWMNSCDGPGGEYDIDCYGDDRDPAEQSYSYSQSQNYTYMTQLVTALVNESKKMK